MTNATPTTAAHVAVGTSPAGIAWNVYPRDGETVAETEGRARVQGERLAKLWARHEGRTVRVRLAAGGMALAGDAAERMEGAADGLTWGATFVQGPRSVLGEVLDRVADYSDPDEIRMRIEGNSIDEVTEAQIEFGIRSALRSVSAAQKAFRAAGI